LGEVRNVAALTVVSVALAFPAAAHAAPTVGATLSKSSVRYGAAHTVNGTLVDGTVALGAQEVVLEGRRYPYEGSYRVIAKTTTDADGKFTFKPLLDRNHRLRVSATAQGVTSQVLQAYTLPALQLRFRALRPGVVRLYQTYTVPKAVRLTSPTLFYLGPRKAKRASLRRTAKVERSRAGRYTSRAEVKLPAGWHGAFRYASCFRPSPGTGMGDPAATCPKLRLAF
jgi:hypothetical protein